MPIETTVFVTGLWRFSNEKTLSAHDEKMLKDSLALISGGQLLLFYEEHEVLEFFRYECFDCNIQLIAAPLCLQDLPGQKYVPEFIKRMLGYGVSQHPEASKPELLEKAWTLYWLDYMRMGLDGFSNFLAAKLSKVELAGLIAPEISNFAARRFCWMDPDFAKWQIDAAQIEQITMDSPGHCLRHFPSSYQYLGRPLPIGSYCMSADESDWPEIYQIYEREIRRLGHFPYAYDEEVTLSLAKAQNPEKFAFFGEIVQIDRQTKTGT